jgi:nucleotide-binding universal stress UspA family protein
MCQAKAGRPQLVGYKHILVPLDGSSFGEAALRPALEVARRSGAGVTLLHVHNPQRASLLRTAEDQETYLARLRRDPACGDIRVEVAMRSGQPAEQIFEQAQAGGADLIVMCTHGRGGVSRAWLGSVTDQCIRHSAIPVLVIRPQPSGRQSDADAFLPHRVVVPLDGGMDAERALPYALGIARAFGVPMLLLGVVEPGRDDMAHGDGVTLMMCLGDVASRLWASGVQVSTEVVHGRSAPEAILTAAGGDPVVMSRHECSRIPSALIGSVTDKVLRSAHGPVLLVPPPSTKGRSGEGPWATSAA